MDWILSASSLTDSIHDDSWFSLSDPGIHGSFSRQIRTRADGPPNSVEKELTVIHLHVLLTVHRLTDPATNSMAPTAI